MIYTSFSYFFKWTVMTKKTQVDIVLKQRSGAGEIGRVWFLFEFRLT